MIKTSLDQINKIAKIIFHKHSIVSKAFLKDVKEALWGSQTFIEMILNTVESIDEKEINKIEFEFEEKLMIDVIVHVTNKIDNKYFENDSLLLIYEANNKNNDYLILAKRHISTAKHLLCLIEENKINNIFTGSVCICIKTSIECIMRHKLFNIGIVLEPKSYNLEYLYSIPSNSDFDYKLPSYIRTRLSMIDSFEQGNLVLNYPVANIIIIEKLIEKTDKYLAQVEQEENE